MGDRALYNEIDPVAAQWLRNLIAAGHVTPGVVDERSIADLAPADVRGVDRVHAFAGIAGWDLALQLAGWRGPVWTGSCPCQSWSSAGKRRGADDERHLWPEWFRLIDACRPPVIFGEQVASHDVVGALGETRRPREGGDRTAWFDLVSADLEGIGYTVGACVLTAAGVGAPHIRQRLYFCALLGVGQVDADITGSQGRDQRRDSSDERAAWARGVDGGLPDTGGGGLGEGERGVRAGEPDAYRRGEIRGVADGEEVRRGQGRGCGSDGDRQEQPRGRRADERIMPGPTNGAWANAEWIRCSDGRMRPAEPGVHPLAHGVPGRVGRLRGYGNAIVPQVAAAFVRAVMDEITFHPEAT